MALKKLMVISKEGYLLLLDFDDEDDDIKVSEEALAEVKSPGFDKNENISPQAEADEYMGDEVDSMLDKSGVKNPAIGKDENISPQVKGDEDMGSIEYFKSCVCVTFTGKVDSGISAFQEMKLTVCWLHLEVFSPENTGLQHLRILLLEV
eukprot:XP_003689042.1 PREDICTED: uncharacterized protein Gm21064 isoform X4 [Mus musculus]